MPWCIPALHVHVVITSNTSLQLDDEPVMHREVMDHESDLLKSYFCTLVLLIGRRV